MKITAKSLVSAFFLFAAIGVTTAAAQSVTGSIAGGRIALGKPARATVVLSIPSGLHVNSSRPGSEYAIPTSVRATSVRGVKISAVSYPRGTNRKFEFSESSLNVYEGRVAFTFNVTVPANYRGQSVRVNVTVRYQACSNEVCYSPKTKTIAMTATVQ